MGTERRRKQSIFDAHSPTVSAPVREDLKYRRSRGFQARKISRDKDFFVPDQVEEWVLPEYRSLFHHLFLKEEDDSISVSHNGSSVRTAIASSSTTSIPTPAFQRRRKISPSGSTASSNTTSSEEEDGPLCNLVKSFPNWLKKVLHISENNDVQQSQDEMDARHAWLDEIPIDICDRLRHIHIYV